MRERTRADTRSPLERMIDAACGRDPGWRPTRALQSVTLRCPRCTRCATVPRHETDAPGTAIVEYPCHDCHPAPDEAVHYFDIQGHAIIEETRAEGTS
jgi:hypothetical protein